MRIEERSEMSDETRTYVSPLSSIKTKTSQFELLMSETGSSKLAALKSLRTSSSCVGSISPDMKDILINPDHKEKMARGNGIRRPTTCLTRETELGRKSQGVLEQRDLPYNTQCRAIFRLGEESVPWTHTHFSISHSSVQAKDQTEIGSALVIAPNIRGSTPPLHAMEEGTRECWITALSQRVGRLLTITRRVMRDPWLEGKTVDDKEEKKVHARRDQPRLLTSRPMD
ncbi:hypothetical protein ARMGADRAFT_1144108 [Armillaria gallica]|uniref:Uncharacterized protein n=1 Tax=Armillaria gallica TaxID=47427 RepID=A0A2H3CSX2_ARMGA|nr:hypothetical protein ARMGADRAFT_1144108 [Armillaria gallica]